MESQPAALQLVSERYYLLRRPLLPVNTLLALHDAGQAGYPAFVAALLAQFEPAEMQEAIYTASPSLHQELLKLGQQPAAAERSTRVVYSLYKYLLRCCVRATPYGMFAGCAMGTVAAASKLDFSAARLRKLTRLDMNYTHEIFLALSTSDALLEKSTYYTNNSVYELDEHYRYIEYQVENKQRSYLLSSVAKTEFLTQILTEGRTGVTYARSLAILTQAIPEAPVAEAEEYLKQLIASQLLISEYAPTITGPLYASELPRRLAGIADEAVVGKLAHVNALLAAGGVANFQLAHATLNDDFISCSANELIQTDLFFETTGENNTLSESAVATIAAELSELYALSPKSVLTDINTFSVEFSKRFEEQEVPLLTALDSDIGIGYGNAAGGGGVYLPLVEGLVVGNGAAPPETTKWDEYSKLVHAKYQHAMTTQARTIDLLPADLHAVSAASPAPPVVPASLAALGTVLAPSGAAVDAGDFQFLLQSCGGPSAANLLARFCYGDEQLQRNLATSLAEAEPDSETVVYAEIVHAPEARVGNILMRPHLRACEIPYLSLSTVAAENQFDASDLLVSVRGGVVVLRSKRLNKRVIPRLSNAHNVAKGLPLYRFLHDLQRHNHNTSLAWRWGALKGREFLPRVVYRHVILERATWNVTAERLLGPARATLAAGEAENRLYQFYQENALPRYVTLIEGDNELLLDFEFTFSRTLLAQFLQKRARVQFKEFLLLPEQCLVAGAQQARYTHEIILPLRNTLARPPASLASLAATHPAARSYLPGSEWLYIKIYSGYKSLEKLLTTTIQPLMQRYEASGQVEKWFFIRYSDPEAHLRLRLRLPGSASQEAAGILADFQAALLPFVASGIVHKLQTDTYIRELERYGGGHNIEPTETWFHHDSQAVLQILCLLEGDAGETYRWLLAMRGLDELLTDFGLALPQKHTLLQQFARAFYQEFHGDKSLQVQLDAKYRQHAREIRSYLNPTDDERNEITVATVEFAHRRRRSAACIEEIRQLYGPDLLASDKGTNLLASYAHMYMNRIIPDKARLHELVVYTLLYKYYTSQLAITKAARTPAAVASPPTA